MSPWRSVKLYSVTNRIDIHDIRSVDNYLLLVSKQRYASDSATSIENPQVYIPHCSHIKSRPIPLGYTTITTIVHLFTIYVATVRRNVSLTTKTERIKILHGNRYMMGAMRMFRRIHRIKCHHRREGRSSDM